MIVVDIDEETLRLIPPRLRSFEFVELLKVLSMSHRVSLAKLVAFVASKDYELAFNGQVIYLEHVLNDVFDAVERRIYITDYDSSPRKYLFNKDEDNEITYLFNKEEDSDEVYFMNNQEEFGYSFIVHVPAGQVSNYDLFRAWVNRYKLRGKSYGIVEF